jgi:uncharacterized metal-binding protein YceD (DUF177 family)
MNPEFSRSFRLDEIGTTTRSVTIEADEAERAALAARFDLLGIERLQAVADLTRNGEVITASGQLNAEVTQACVASGEPVPAKVNERFAFSFVPEPTELGPEEVELAEPDLDAMEYQGSAIDLGEAVAQTLVLAIDPFPRASGADDKLRAAGVVGEEDLSPFAMLKALKDKL